MSCLNDLHKTFNPGTVTGKVQARNVPLPYMEAGDFATIVGSNGAGKPPCSTPSPAASSPTRAASCCGQDITLSRSTSAARSSATCFRTRSRAPRTNMTIEENLALAYLRAGTAPHAIFSRISRKDKAKCSAKSWRCWRALRTVRKQLVGLLFRRSAAGADPAYGNAGHPLGCCCWTSITAALTPPPPKRCWEPTKSIGRKEDHLPDGHHNMHQALELGNRT